MSEGTVPADEAVALIREIGTLVDDEARQVLRTTIALAGCEAVTAEHLRLALARSGQPVKAEARLRKLGLSLAHVLRRSRRLAADQREVTVRVDHLRRAIDEHTLETAGLDPARAAFTRWRVAHLYGSAPALRACLQDRQAASVQPGERTGRT
jgi:hypothetical protein